MRRVHRRCLVHPLSREACGLRGFFGVGTLAVSKDKFKTNITGVHLLINFLAKVRNRPIYHARKPLGIQGVQWRCGCKSAYSRRAALLRPLRRNILCQQPRVVLADGLGIVPQNRRDLLGALSAE